MPLLGDVLTTTNIDTHYVLEMSNEVNNITIPPFPYLNHVLVKVGVQSDREISCVPVLPECLQVTMIITNTLVMPVTLTFGAGFVADGALFILGNRHTTISFVSDVISLQEIIRNSRG